MAAIHPRRRGIRLTASLVAVTLAVALSASACSSDKDGSEGSGKSTLVVQSGLGGSPAILAAYEKLNEKFEAENGVKVDFVTKSFDDLANTAKLTLSGGNPPDVIQTNRGYQAMGAFVKGGLLVNLDDYAAKYGWDKRQSEEQLQLNRFKEDGVRMGEGPLWGMSATSAWIGMLVNNNVAKELGITEPPKTIAELESQMEKAKEGGFVPFAFGSANGELAAWLLSELLLAKGGPSAVQDLVFHNNDATFTSDTAKWAADTMKSWGDKGYFTPDWTAYKTDQVMGNFTKGGSLFTLTSSRFMPLAETDQTDQIGMVAFPGVEGDGLAAVAAGDIPWTIPAKSKNQDLAAKYIDFVTNAESAKSFLEGGAIPSFPPSDAEAVIKAGDFPRPSREALSTGLRVLGEGTPIPYVDWGAPELYPVISDSFDLLMSGSLSPEKFAEQLQNAYGPFVDSLEQGS